VYHYTDKEGILGMMRTRKMLPSVRPGDECLGQGQYFTTMGPESDSDELVRNNWGSNSEKYDKVAYYVRIERKKLGQLIKAAGRNVLLNPSKESLNLREVEARFFQR
jgi:hypothetical protein